jgi:hypothetical protein
MFNASMTIAGFEPELTRMMALCCRSPVYA